MLLILIPIAWLAVVALVVAVCQAAARDETRGAHHEERTYRVRDGLTVWEHSAAAALHHVETHATSTAPASAPRPTGRARRRAQVVAHGAR